MEQQDFSPTANQIVKQGRNFQKLLSQQFSVAIVKITESAKQNQAEQQKSVTSQ